MSVERRIIMIVEPYFKYMLHLLLCDELSVLRPLSQTALSYSVCKKKLYPNLHGCLIQEFHVEIVQIYIEGKKQPAGH